MRLRAAGVAACATALIVASPARSVFAEPVTEVPFTFVRGALIVPVFVGDAGPLTMMLDTGVDPSIVDLATARRIGLNVAAEGSAGSGGGSDVNLAHETMFPSVEVGGVSARRVAALAADLSKTAAALGRPLDGVLGHSFLGGRLIEIDYPARVVRFFATRRAFDARPRRSAPAATLRIRYDDEILIDDVLVDGRRMTANLDTGSNATFQVTPQAVATLGLEAQVRAMPDQASVGINGITRNRSGTLGSVRLGALVVDSPPAVFYGADTGHDHEAWGLRIGNGFLQDFIVTIDETGGCVTLTRPSPRPSSRRRGSRASISLHSGVRRDDAFGPTRELTRAPDPQNIVTPGIVKLAAEG